MQFHFVLFLLFAAAAAQVEHGEPCDDSDEATKCRTGLGYDFVKCLGTPGTCQCEKGTWDPLFKYCYSSHDQACAEDLTTDPPCYQGTGLKCDVTTDKCICKYGVWDSDIKACFAHHKETCDITGISNPRCSPKEYLLCNDDKVCACPDNREYRYGQCQALNDQDCSEKGDYLNGDREPQCLQGVRLKCDGSTKKCTCTKGNWDNGVHGCFAGHGDACNNDGFEQLPCNPQNFLACLDNKCTCDATRELQDGKCHAYGDQTCTEKGDYGRGDFQPGCMSGKNLFCNTDSVPSKCACRFGAEWIKENPVENRGSCLAKYEGECHNSSSIYPPCNKNKHFVCAGAYDKCFCPAGSRVTASRDKCVALHGGPCSSDGAKLPECLKFRGEPSDKSSFLTCNVADLQNPRCECKVPGSIWDPEAEQCFATYGGLCSLTGESVPTCMAGNNEICDIASKTCVCGEDFFRDEDTGTCQRLYSKPCQVHGDCPAEGYMECVNRMCRCLSNYSPAKVDGVVRCLGNYGTYCDENHHCYQRKGFACGDEFTCGCSSSLSFDNSTGSCVAPLGKACNSTEDGELLFGCGANQSCAENICACISGFSEGSNGQCRENGGSLSQISQSAVGIAVLVYLINSIVDRV